MSGIYITMSTSCDSTNQYSVIVLQRFGKQKTYRDFNSVCQLSLNSLTLKRGNRASFELKTNKIFFEFDHVLRMYVKN